MIRLVLVDDHNLVRQGIRSLLEKAGDLEIVGEADNGHDAIELVDQLMPDVLLMDISMPRMNGLEALTRLKAQRPATRVIILSMHSDKTVVLNVLRNGARGYLLKQSAVDELLLAIRYVCEGGTYVSPAISETLLPDLLASSANDNAAALAALTLREREVLQLIAEGKTSREIGEFLTITVKTVEKHRSNLMAKLSVHDVASLTRLAVKYGVVSADS